MNKAVTTFIETMTVRWPPFRWDELQERAYADDLMRELSGYSPEVLERARRDMVRKRTKTQTPSVAECLAACAEAKRWSTVETSKDQLISNPAREGLSEWSPERVGLAYELIRTTLGKQAARENWILGLWNFIRRQGRHPAEKEISQLRADAKSFDETHARIVRASPEDWKGGPQMFNAVLNRAHEGWAASIIAKRKGLAAEATGAR